MRLTANEPKRTNEIRGGPLVGRHRPSVCPRSGRRDARVAAYSDSHRTPAGTRHDPGAGGGANGGAADAGARVGKPGVRSQRRRRVPLLDWSERRARADRLLGDQLRNWEVPGECRGNPERPVPVHGQLGQQQRLAVSIQVGGALAPIACSTADCETGTDPYWLAITPNGKFLYASDFEGPEVSPFAIQANGSLVRSPAPSARASRKETLRA